MARHAHPPAFEVIRLYPGHPRRVRRVALSMGAAFGAAALGLMALSLYWADDLADWRLPGLAALAAIACTVMLMIAARVRR